MLHHSTCAAAEVVLALMRHPEFCVYGQVVSEQARGADKAERWFERQSVTELSKFKEETLSNYGGKMRRSKLSRGELGTGL